MEKPLNTTKRGVTDAEGDEVATFKIEVPANRYDLLCLEGLATALNAFNGREPPPTFTLAPPPASGPLLVTVSPETSEIRPYVVCAILRDVALTPAAYTSLIELQDRCARARADRARVRARAQAQCSAVPTAWVRASCRWPFRICLRRSQMAAARRRQLVTCGSPTPRAPR